jgi:hypothetical protein
MGTSREAAVRLTLSASQFSAGMRQLADKVDMQWQQLGRRMEKHISAGMGGAKQSLGQLGGHAKNALGMVTGLAAGFSFAGAVKHTLELDERLKTLSYRIKLATGEIESAAQLQDLFEQKAAKTGRTVGDMADAFETVYAATRDLQYSKDVLEAVANTATATGESITNIGTLAHQMQRKFQLSAGEVGDALAQVAQGAVQGGPSIQEFAATFDQLGAVMLQNGMRGKQALGFIVGALNATDSEGAALGARVSGLQAMFTKLASPTVLEHIAKALSIPAKELLDEKGFEGRLSKILRHGEKGIGALKRVFVEASEQSVARILFLDPFRDAVKKAQTSGLKGRDAVEQAVRSVEGQIAKFGEASVKAADIAAEAGNRQQDASRRLTLAMDALNTAVARPEVVGALEDLAAKAPEVADGFGKLLRWVIQNPILAGVMGVGGFASKGFLAEMSKSIVASHIEGVKAWAAANQVAAARMAGALKVAGAGVAAMIAFELGKRAIDATFQQGAEAQGKTAAALANTANTGGGLKGAKGRLAELEKALAAERAAGSGWTGAVEGTLGTLAKPFMPEGVHTLSDQRRTRIAHLERGIAEERARVKELSTKPKTGWAAVDDLQGKLDAEREGWALQSRLTGGADPEAGARIAELERKLEAAKATAGPDPRAPQRIAELERKLAAEREGWELQKRQGGGDPERGGRIAELERKLATERQSLAAARARSEQPETKPAAPPTKTRAVLDESAPRAISLAVTSALDRTLRVEVVNWQGGRTTAAAGGSRGPMVVARATPGGGN